MCGVGKSPGCYLCPPLNVETVFPSHLYVVAFAESMAVQVGKKDVEAKVTMVHPTEIEELYAAILISVYDDGCPAMRGIVTK